MRARRAARQAASACLSLPQAEAACLPAPRQLPQSCRQAAYCLAPASGWEAAALLLRLCLWKLRNLSVDFRKMQKQYLARLKAKEGGGKGGSSLDVFDEMQTGRGGIDDGMYDGDDDVGFTDGQLARMKESESFSVEREKEIEEIVKSVNDLATVMKDLSVLIVDQGTVLDRIDYNMTAVAESVEEGLKELQQAEKTQKRSRMFLCIIMLFALCTVMAVILVLKNMF